MMIRLRTTVINSNSLTIHETVYQLSNYEVLKEIVLIIQKTFEYFEFY